MNTLRDTLKDLIEEVMNPTDILDKPKEITEYDIEDWIDEYVERIKNELNVDKYFE